MPVNKYATIRHRIIDKMIGNKYKPFPSKDNLIEACEEALYGEDGGYISDSTIEKDLQYMKLEFDAPIKFSRKNGGYFYDDPNFSIDLNSSQIEAIKLAANILEQFKGTEVFKDFDSAIDKILDRVNASEKLQQKEASRYIQFEKAPIVIGTEHLDPLIQAIRDKQKVCFTYQKFKGGNEKERLLDPYLLKEYRNRWYVTGYDTEKENIITYALDRIKNLEVKFQTFETDKNFNPERYFEYAIGITTSNKNPELIKLSLSPTEGKYLKSQPLHHSQKVISDTENECIIQLYVVITYELINQILSLGEGVKVIEPPILVDQIKNSLNNSLNKYS